MKHLKQFFIIQILMVFVSINAFSQAGSLDPTFATNGKFVYDNGFNDLFHCTAIQEDQKIIAAGVSYDAAYTATAKVFRFMPDGSIDTDFATDGVFSYSLNNEANINDVVIKDNGKIILVGSTTDYSNYKILILQLNDDGTLDNTFGTNGVVVQKISPASGPYEDFGYAVTLQSDGKILVAGRSDDLSYNGVPVVVRFNENGTLDTSFGTDGVAGITVTGIDNVFDCIALQEDGKIVVSGHYELGLQYFGMLVARFDSNGTLDDSFADDGVFIDSFGDVDDEGYGVVINSEGKIIVTGFTATAEFVYSMLLMQLDSDGNLDMNFGTDGLVYSNFGNYNAGSAITIQDDDKILIAGSSGELPPTGDSEMTVWRYNTDGTLDDTFGDEGISFIQFDSEYDEALGMVLQDDQKIVIAGKARSSDNQNMDFALARLLNDEELLQADFEASPNPACAGETVDFTDMSTGDIATWSWTFEGGTPSTSSEQNPSVVYDTPGLYDVELEIISTDEQTSSTLMADYMNILDTPAQAATPEGPVSVCTDPASDYTSAGADDATSYEWTLSPEFAGSIDENGLEATVTWDVEFSGIATLTITGINACGEGTPSEELEILVGAANPIITGEEIVCDFSTEIYEVDDNEGSTYTWEVTGGEISEGQGTYIITIDWNGEGDGAITVGEETIDGCSGSSEEFAVMIDDCTGIGENDLDKQITVHPNPATDAVVVEAKENISEVSVYTLSGKLILKNETINKRHAIDVSTIERGLYLLRITTGSGTISKKLIIR